MLHRDPGVTEAPVKTAAFQNRAAARGIVDEFDGADARLAREDRGQSDPACGQR